MKLLSCAALAGALMFAPLSAAADPLTYPALKTMVENMGYTPKELGSEDSPKFEATVVTADFNVPIGFEVTKSGRYIWTTASLGDSKLDGERALSLLKRGQEIQPTQFWINSKGVLMIGLAIDNREITPAHIKFVMEKLSADLGKMKDIWQVPAAAQ